MKTKENPMTMTSKEMNERNGSNERFLEQKKTCLYPFDWKWCNEMRLMCKRAYLNAETRNKRPNRSKMNNELRKTVWCVLMVKIMESNRNKKQTCKNSNNQMNSWKWSKRRENGNETNSGCDGHRNLEIERR